MELALGIVVSKEPWQILERFFQLVHLKYRPQLSLLMVENRSPFPMREFLKKLFPDIKVEIWEEPELKKQLAISYFHMMDRFLEHGAPALILCDADLLILRPPQTLYDWQGDFNFYRRNKVVMASELMSQFEAWHSHFDELGLWERGVVHSVNGGWMLYSRRLVQAIEPDFYRGPTNEEWQEGQWGMEEMYLGFLIWRVRKNWGDDFRSGVVSSSQKKTGEAEILAARSILSISAKELKNATVVHRFKTKPQLIEHIMQRLPNELKEELEPIVYKTYTAPPSY